MGVMNWRAVTSIPVYAGVVRSFARGTIKRAVAAAVLATIAASANAAPQLGMSPAVVRDIECLALTAALAADSDADKSKGGQIGTAYFGGKLEVEAPSLNMPSAVRSVVTKEGDKGLNAARDRCSDEMQKLGERLTATGTSLRDSPIGK